MGRFPMASRLQQPKVSTYKHKLNEMIRIVEIVDKSRI